MSRASEIERIQAVAQKLQKEEAQAVERFKLLQQEAAEANAQLDTARSELRVLQEDKIRFTSEHVRAERDVAAQKKQFSDLLEEKENAAGRIEKLSAVIDRADENIHALEVKAAETKHKMESMAESREEQMRRCDEMTHKLQEIRLQGLTVQKDKETLIASIEALQMRLADRFDRMKMLEGQITTFEAEITQKEEQTVSLKSEVETLREKAAGLRNSVQEIAEKRTALEKQAAELRVQERDTSARRESVGLEIARLRERLENLSREYDTILAKLWEEYELTRREAEELGVTIEDIPKAQRRLSELKNKIRALGAVNVAAVVEYKEVSERYTFMKAQTDDVEKSKAELLKLIDDLTKKMQVQFTERFAVINDNFGKIFKDLFGGGSAELSFTDESDILNSGIEIKVHPPGKIVSHIELLSGGEKALVAISIYFAIMRVSPPPFCMLDEIEAALDDVNVVRFANYLRRMNDRTQFIAITHRRGTMEEADMLYGVTMQDQGISKLLSLRTHEVEEKLGL